MELNKEIRIYSSIVKPQNKTVLWQGSPIHNKVVKSF